MYECGRCGCQFKRKNNFIRHLKRKFICKPIKKDICPLKILNEYNFNETKTNYVCQFCNKKYTRYNNLVRQFSLN